MTIHGLINHPVLEIAAVAASAYYEPVKTAHGLIDSAKSSIQSKPAVLGIAALAACAYYAPVQTAMIGVGAFFSAAAFHNWAANREIQTIQLVEDAAGLSNFKTESAPQREEALRAMNPEEQGKALDEQRLATLQKTAFEKIQPTNRALFANQLGRIVHGLPQNAKERVVLSDLLLKIPEAKREKLAVYFEKIGFSPEQKLKAFKILAQEIPSDIKQDDIIQLIANLPEYFRLAGLERLRNMVSQEGWQASFQNWSVSFRQISDQLIHSWMAPNQKQEVLNLLLAMPQEQRSIFLGAVNAVCPPGDPLRFQVILAIAASGRDISKIVDDVKLLASAIKLKNPTVQNKLDLIDILTGIQANGRLKNAPFDRLPVEDKIKLFKIFAHLTPLQKKAAISALPINATTEGQETILKKLKEIPENKLYIVEIAKSHLITPFTPSDERAKYLELLLVKTNSKENALLLSSKLDKLMGTIKDPTHRLSILTLLIESKTADLKDTLKLITDATELTQHLHDSDKPEILRKFMEIPESEKGVSLIDSSKRLISLLNKREKRASLLKSILDIQTLDLRVLFFKRMNQHILINHDLQKNGRELLKIAEKEFEQIKLLEEFIKPETYALRSEIVAHFETILPGEDPKDVLTQVLQLEEVPNELKHQYFGIIAKIAKDQRPDFISHLKKITSLISHRDQKALPQYLSSMAPQVREEWVVTEQIALRNQLERLSEEVPSETQKRKVAEIFQKIPRYYKEQFADQALDLISIFTKSLSKTSYSIKILGLQGQLTEEEKVDCIQLAQVLYLSPNLDENRKLELIQTFRRVPPAEREKWISAFPKRAAPRPPLPSESHIHEVSPKEQAEPLAPPLNEMLQAPLPAMQAERQPDSSPAKKRKRNA